MHCQSFSHEQSGSYRQRVQQQQQQTIKPKTAMKHVKPITTTIAALSLAAVAFVLHPQQGISEPALPPQGHSFNGHYAETDLMIGAALTDDDGIHPGMQSLPLPILNRTIRLSLTFTGTDGEVCFGEVVAYYKSAAGVCGFQDVVNGSAVSGGAGFSLLNTLPDGSSPGSAAGINLFTAPDGKIAVSNYHSAGGSIHVAFWY
jgi:hypothetical protein